MPYGKWQEIDHPPRCADIYLETASRKDAVNVSKEVCDKIRKAVEQKRSVLRAAAQTSQNVISKSGLLKDLLPKAHRFNKKSVIEQTQFSDRITKDGGHSQPGKVVSKNIGIVDKHKTLMEENPCENRKKQHIQYGSASVSEDDTRIRHQNRDDKGISAQQPAPYNVVVNEMGKPKSKSAAHPPPSTMEPSIFLASTACGTNGDGYSEDSIGGISSAWCSPNSEVEVRAFSLLTRCEHQVRKWRPTGLLYDTEGIRPDDMCELTDVVEKSKETSVLQAEEVNEELPTRRIIPWYKSLQIIAEGEFVLTGVMMAEIMKKYETDLNSTNAGREGGLDRNFLDIAMVYSQVNKQITQTAICTNGTADAFRNLDEDPCFMLEVPEKLGLKPKPCTVLRPIAAMAGQALTILQNILIDFETLNTNRMLRYFEQGVQVSARQAAAFREFVDQAVDLSDITKSMLKLPKSDMEVTLLDRIHNFTCAIGRFSSKMRKHLLTLCMNAKEDSKTACLALRERIVHMDDAMAKKQIEATQELRDAISARLAIQFDGGNPVVSDVPIAALGGEGASGQPDNFIEGAIEKIRQAAASNLEQLELLADEFNTCIPAIARSRAVEKGNVQSKFDSYSEQELSIYVTETLARMEELKNSLDHMESIKALRRTSQTASLPSLALLQMEYCLQDNLLEVLQEQCNDLVATVNADLGDGTWHLSKANCHFRTSPRRYLLPMVFSEIVKQLRRGILSLGADVNDELRRLLSVFEAWNATISDEQKKNKRNCRNIDVTVSMDDSVEELFCCLRGEIKKKTEPISAITRTGPAKRMPSMTARPIKRGSSRAGSKEPVNPAPTRKPSTQELGSEISKAVERSGLQEDRGFGESFARRSNGPNVNRRYGGERDKSRRKGSSSQQTPRESSDYLFSLVELESQPAKLSKLKRASTYALADGDIEAPNHDEQQRLAEENPHIMSLHSKIQTCKTEVQENETLLALLHQETIHLEEKKNEFKEMTEGIRKITEHRKILHALASEANSYKVNMKSKKAEVKSLARQFSGLDMGETYSELERKIECYEEQCKMENIWTELLPIDERVKRKAKGARIKLAMIQKLSPSGTIQLPGEQATQDTTQDTPQGKTTTVLELMPQEIRGFVDVVENSEKIAKMSASEQLKFRRAQTVYKMKLNEILQQKRRLETNKKNNEASLERRRVELKRVMKDISTQCGIDTTEWLTTKGEMDEKWRKEMSDMRKELARQQKVLRFWDERTSMWHKKIAINHGLQVSQHHKRKRFYLNVDLWTRKMTSYLLTHIYSLARKPCEVVTSTQAPAMSSTSVPGLGDSTIPEDSPAQFPMTGFFNPITGSQDRAQAHDRAFFHKTQKDRVLKQAAGSGTYNLLMCSPLGGNLQSQLSKPPKDRGVLAHGFTRFAVEPSKRTPFDPTLNASQKEEFPSEDVTDVDFSDDEVSDSNESIDEASPVKRSGTVGRSSKSFQNDSDGLADVRRRREYHKLRNMRKKQVADDSSASRKGALNLFLGMLDDASPRNQNPEPKSPAARSPKKRRAALPSFGNSKDVTKARPPIPLVLDFGSFSSDAPLRRGSSSGVQRRGSTLQDAESAHSEQLARLNQISQANAEIDSKLQVGLRLLRALYACIRQTFASLEEAHFWAVGDVETPIGWTEFSELCQFLGFEGEEAEKMFDRAIAMSDLSKQSFPELGRSEFVRVLQGVAPADSLDAVGKRIVEKYQGLKSGFKKFANIQGKSISKSAFRSMMEGIGIHAGEAKRIFMQMFRHGDDPHVSERLSLTRRTFIRVLKHAIAIAAIDKLRENLAQTEIDLVVRGKSVGSHMPREPELDSNTDPSCPRVLFKTILDKIAPKYWLKPLRFNRFQRFACFLGVAEEECNAVFRLLDRYHITTVTLVDFAASVSGGVGIGRKMLLAHFYAKRARNGNFRRIDYVAAARAYGYGQTGLRKCERRKIAEMRKWSQVKRMRRLCMQSHKTRFHERKKAKGSVKLSSRTRSTRSIEMFPSLMQDAGEDSGAAADQSGLEDVDNASNLSGADSLEELPEHPSVEKPDQLEDPQQEVIGKSRKFWRDEGQFHRTSAGCLRSKSARPDEDSCDSEIATAGKSKWQLAKLVGVKKAQNKFLKQISQTKQVSKPAVSRSRSKTCLTGSLIISSGVKILPEVRTKRFSSETELTAAGNPPLDNRAWWLPSDSHVKTSSRKDIWDREQANLRQRAELFNGSDAELEMAIVRLQELRRQILASYKSTRKFYEKFSGSASAVLNLEKAKAPLMKTLSLNSLDMHRILGLAQTVSGEKWPEVDYAAFLRIIRFAAPASTALEFRKRLVQQFGIVENGLHFLTLSRSAEDGSHGADVGEFCKRMLILGILGQDARTIFNAADLSQLGGARGYIEEEHLKYALDNSHILAWCEIFFHRVAARNRDPCQAICGCVADKDMVCNSPAEFAQALSPLAFPPGIALAVLEFMRARSKYDEVTIGAFADFLNSLCLDGDPRSRMDRIGWNKATESTADTSAQGTDSGNPGANDEVRSEALRTVRQLRQYLKKYFRSTAEVVEVFAVSPNGGVTLDSWNDGMTKFEFYEASVWERVFGLLVEWKHIRWDPKFSGPLPEVTHNMLQQAFDLAVPCQTLAVLKNRLTDRIGNVQKMWAAIAGKPGAEDATLEQWTRCLLRTCSILPEHSVLLWTMVRCMPFGGSRLQSDGPNLVRNAFTAFIKNPDAMTKLFDLFVHTCNGKACFLNEVAEDNIESDVRPCSCIFENVLHNGPLSLQAWEKCLHEEFGMNGADARSLFNYLDVEKEGNLELDVILDALTTMQAAYIPQLALKKEKREIANKLKTSDPFPGAMEANATVKRAKTIQKMMTNLSLHSGSLDRKYRELNSVTPGPKNSRRPSGSEIQKHPSPVNGMEDDDIGTRLPSAATSLGWESEPSGRVDSRCSTARHGYKRGASVMTGSSMSSTSPPDRMSIIKGTGISSVTLAEDSDSSQESSPKRPWTSLGNSAAFAGQVDSTQIRPRKGFTPNLAKTGWSRLKTGWSQLTHKKSAEIVPAVAARNSVVEFGPDSNRRFALVTNLPHLDMDLLGDTVVKKRSVLKRAQSNPKRLARGRTAGLSTTNNQVPGEDLPRTLAPESSAPSAPSAMSMIFSGPQAEEMTLKKTLPSIGLLKRSNISGL